MKNFFLLSVLALGAMTMSAQIEYVTTLNGSFNLSHSLDEEIYSSSKYGEYVYTFNDSLRTLSLYDNDFTVSKVISITISGKPKRVRTYTVGKNLFSDDGKICFIVSAVYASGEEGDNGYKKYWVFNEDGIIIKDFNKEYDYYTYTSCFALNGSNYLAIIKETSPFTADIYSLPTISTNFNETSAPARTSNARKVVENGQMYIILDGIKYAVTGSTTL